MSFWGGFVEGFATELGKGVDKAVDTDAEIVKDTVKIGVNKYLENEQEIKTEKKTIRDELDMLRALKFSLPKAASIIRAGQTANVIKLTNKYTGADPNDLWDGTTKFAEEKGLTVNDILDKLVKTPAFDAGNLKVEQPQGSLLSALGLGTDVSSRIKKGIATRVGDTGATTTTRDDIAVMPGGLTATGKGLISTSSDNIDQTILKLSKKKIAGTIEPGEETLLKEITDLKYGKTALDKINVSPFFGGGAKQTSIPIDMNLLNRLHKKAISNDPDAKDAQQKIDKIIDQIKNQPGGQNLAQAIVDTLKNTK